MRVQTVQGPAVAQLHGAFADDGGGATVLERRDFQNGEFTGSRETGLHIEKRVYDLPVVIRRNILEDVEKRFLSAGWRKVRVNTIESESAGLWGIVANLTA